MTLQLIAIITILSSCINESNSTGIAENNIYEVINDSCVKIGNQIWMNKNLDVEQYRNGDPIRYCGTFEEWRDASLRDEGAWGYFNNDPTNGAKYGKLYNWYAVIDKRGLAPQGWHVPSDADWAVLVANIGGESAGGKLKSKGTIEAGNGLWYSPNTGATNETGFSALPCGDGNLFANLTLGRNACFWSTTEDSFTTALYLDLWFRNSNARRTYHGKSVGLSVRCLKD